MKKLYIFLSVLLVAYVVARAINVAFTHDEAATFTYLKSPVWDILINEPPTANNHILNTLLAKFCAIFSVREFSLRLPNVVAFLVYIYTVYRLRALITTDKVLQLCFFLAMFANVAMLDFFALCRGYGLGISLLIFSVYQFLLLYINDGGASGRTVQLCLLSSTLAVLANFALVTPAFVIFTLVFVRQYRTNGRRLLPAIASPLVYGLLLLTVCAYNFRRLMVAGELYYGGEMNFIKDTLYTMLDDMTGGWVREPQYYTKMLVFFATIILLSIGTAVFSIRATRTPRRILPLAPLLLAGCIMLINAQFYLLGTKLIIYRTALYLFPLIVISAFSAVELVRMPVVFKRSSSLLVSLLFVVTLLAKVNVTTTREWWYDVHTKEVLAYILQHRPSSSRKARLFSHWLMSRSLDYYVDTRYSKCLEPVLFIQQELTEVNIDSYDFVYVRPQDGMQAFKNFELVQSYAEGNLLLYERKQEIPSATK